jgi:hypothetical protein
METFILYVQGAVPFMRYRVLWKQVFAVSVEVERHDTVLWMFVELSA